MKRNKLLILILLWLIPMIGMATEQISVKRINFTTTAYLDSKEISFSLKEALEKGPVVVYFFPAAYTKGCDLQAHAFSQHKAQFDTHNTTIVGISADPATKLKDFSANPDFADGAIAMVSDPDGKIGAQFGLDMSQPIPGIKDINGDTVTHGFLPRVTFVLNQNGQTIKRLSEKEDNIKPSEHASKALEVVKVIE